MRRRGCLGAKMRVGLAASLMAAGLAAPANPSTTAEVQGRDVCIQGVLRVGEFLGPPGYGEDPRSDRAETSYYLQLPARLDTQDSAITAVGDWAEALARTGYFLQIVVQTQDQKNARRLVGSKVQVTGTLFEGATGHHRTPILLDVRSLRSIQRWGWWTG